MVVLAIAGAVLAAYANSFPGAFFFDDEAAILQNTSLRDLHAWRHVLWPPESAGIGGRPFANLTFALNYAMSGYSAAAFHAVDLAIHLAAALLLFGAVRQTLLRPRLAPQFGSVATLLGGFVALLWALHPLDTNIVDYVSQRTEGLMSALYLLTLYAFIRSAELESRGWAIVAVVACAIGMATKEGMVTAPVVVLLYDRTFISGTFLAALRRHARTYAGLVATWILLAGLMISSHLSARGVGFGLGRSWYEYALTECRSVVRYLQLAVWPHPLIFDYGANYLHHFSEAAPSFAVLLVAIAATIYALRRAPAVGFAGAWFFILLAPSSSVVPVVQQPCAENRPYLAIAGIMALIGIAAYRALDRRAFAALALIVVALGVATAKRNPAFSSEVAVWADTVAKNPANARAENNLGNALLKTGRMAEAAPHFDAAIRLSPGYADAHNNRGVILLRQGRTADALVEFQTAVAHKNNYADAEYNLGEAYLQLGRAADALPALQAALKLDPDNPKIHNNLGIALLDTGHLAESVAAERRALALLPNMPEAHYNLGNSLDKSGQTAQALEEFEAAARLDPKFAKAFNNAGVMLLRLGRSKEAAAQFEAALRLNPSYPEAKSNLALVQPLAAK